MENRITSPETPASDSRRRESLKFSFSSRSLVFKALEIGLFRALKIG